jgi:hypothetical protein
VLPGFLVRQAQMMRNPELRRWRRLQQEYQRISSDAPDIFRQPVFARLAEGVRYCFEMGVDGHMAEFGTMSGQTAAVIARSLRFCSKLRGENDRRHGIGTRRLHLFDSFEGLPETTSEVDRSSLHVAAGVWAPGTCKGVSSAELVRMCSEHIERERIVVYEGWFKDTLSTIDPALKLALVHLDCDLYESTAQVLEHLVAHNHLADGAMLLFDDWNCNRASPGHGQRRAWKELVERHGLEHSDQGGYGIAGRCFIVHTGG